MFLNEPFSDFAWKWLQVHLFCGRRSYPSNNQYSHKYLTTSLVTLLCKLLIVHPGRHDVIFRWRCCHTHSSLSFLSVPFAPPSLTPLNTHAKNGVGDGLPVSGRGFAAIRLPGENSKLRPAPRESGIFDLFCDLASNPLSVWQREREMWTDLSLLFPWGCLLSQVTARGFGKWSYDHYTMTSAGIFCLLDGSDKRRT